MVKKTLRKIIF